MFNMCVNILKPWNIYGYYKQSISVSKLLAAI